MEYKGSCHCGSIKFVAEGELSEVYLAIVQYVKRKILYFGSYQVSKLIFL